MIHKIRYFLSWGLYIGAQWGIAINEAFILEAGAQRGIAINEAFILEAGAQRGIAINETFILEHNEVLQKMCFFFFLAKC